MGESSRSSLLTGTRFTPVSIAVGQSLPKNTYLCGRLVLLFPFSTAIPDQLRFRLAAKYSANVTPNDYVSATPSRQIKWTFDLTLSPSAEARKTWASEKEALEAEHARLKDMMGRMVEIAGDGLAITAVSGTSVQLEATGPRLMATEGKDAWTVFQVASQSTITPSWLETPSLPSPTDSLAPSPPMDRPAHLKPITSLIPPKFHIHPLQVEKRRPVDSHDASRPTKRVHLGGTGPSARDPAFVHPQPIRSSRQPITRGSSSIPKVGSLESLASDPAPAIDTHGEEVFQPRATPLEVVHPAQPDQPIPSQKRPERPSSPTALPIKSDVEDSRGTPAPPSPHPDNYSADTGMVNAPTARALAEAAAREEALRQQAAERAQADEQIAQLDLLRKPFEANRVRYTPLQEAKSGLLLNLMGIIIKVDPVKKGKMGDYHLNVVITDLTTHSGDQSDEALVITIFRAREEQLPIAAMVGCPILFRNIRTNQWNGKVKGNAYSGDPNGWVYIVDDTKPKISDSRGLNPPLVKEEVDRLLEFKKWWNGDPSRTAGTAYVDAPGQVAARAASRNSSEYSASAAKTRCLGDVRVRDFSDLVVKLIHVHPARFVHFELYVVDGTLSPEPLRNYHNITHPHIPMSGVYMIEMKTPPLPEYESYFQPGNILLLPNVRAKQYRGGLDMIWSEKITDEQYKKGFREKVPVLISPSDERAELLERRIASFRNDGRGQSVVPKFEEPAAQLDALLPRAASMSRTSSSNYPAQSAQPAPFVDPAPEAVPPPAPPIPPPRAQVPLATHVYTTFTDPIEHPTQTIAQVLNNGTYPNKFRVKARVRSVFNRGLKGNDSFAQKHCSHCKRAIVKQAYCMSCNDVQMLNAAWRYCFIAVLEDDEATMPIVISDDEAARFLPPLPPLSASTNPNDIKKTNRQIAETKKGVLDVLQGAPMDNIRPAPYIDWTLQSYIAALPKGYASVKGEKGVLVHKAFGMEAR